MRENLMTPARRLLAPALLLTAMTLVAPAFVRAQDEKPADNATYTWTFKFKKGDVYYTKDKSEGKLNLGGMDITFVGENVTKHEIKEVAENGDVTDVETLESSKISINGMEIDNPEKDRKVTTVTNKSGIIVKRKVENSSQADSPLEKLNALSASFPIPSKPVKVGDTWKTELDNPMVEGKKVTATSKLTGKEKVGDVETLVVKIEGAIPPKADATEKDHIKVTGTYYVNPQTGRLVKVKGILENAELDIMGMSTKLNGESEMVVLSEKEVADLKKKG
jgi:hypothetical protein